MKDFFNMTYILIVDFISSLLEKNKDEIKYCKMVIINLLHTEGLYILLAAMIAFCVHDYILIFFLITLYLLIIINRRTNIIKENSDINMYDKDTPDLLNALIHSCIVEYIIFNRGYEKTTYITNDEENKIMRIVADMVTIRLSSIMITKLRIYYGDKYEDIISSTIYMAVMSYVLKNNTDDLSNYTGHKQNTTNISEKLI